MIAKLMKYDIKKMTRILVYIYACSLGFAGLTRLIQIWDDVQVVAIVGYVFQGITYSAICSVLINTIVHIIMAFINNFYKDESYLTHTLPVSKQQLFLSKYLSSLVVILASVLVSFASLFILLYSKEFMESLKLFITATVSNFNMSIGLFLTMIILIVFSQICAMMSMAFAAIVKGNTYSTNKIRKGLLWFFIFYFGSVICTLILAALVFAVSGNISEFLATALSQGAFITLLATTLVAYLLYSIVFYIWSAKLFSRGVNVD